AMVSVFMTAAEVIDAIIKEISDADGSLSTFEVTLAALLRVADELRSTASARTRPAVHRVFILQALHCRADDGTLVCNDNRSRGAPFYGERGNCAATGRFTRRRSRRRCDERRASKCPRDVADG